MSIRIHKVLASVVGLVFMASCAAIQEPRVEPFFAYSQPPTNQELRWSNGRTPRSLDPTEAVAAPETDLIRAIFEGLTRIDPTGTDVVPAAAESWQPSKDYRTWTFVIRDDARWSNGRSLTASDFVRSWERLRSYNVSSSHRPLLRNILGFESNPKKDKSPQLESQDLIPESVEEIKTKLPSDSSSKVDPRAVKLFGHLEANPLNVGQANTEHPDLTVGRKVGFTAINERTLEVNLVMPDKEFPKLVANPIFSPVYLEKERPFRGELTADIVTNGAFVISEISEKEVTIRRSEKYWDAKNVGLETVRFISAEKPEHALEAYKNGEVDAVTNADFEPLALKLLAPYEDFHQTTHSALNFLEFNTKTPPFSDRRVRSALSISIDRERLADGELGGSTQPANTLLPMGANRLQHITYDVAKAADLMEKAGYADRQIFPTIRLVVNRNDTQQRVARSVARMWKQNLNLDTEIIVIDPSEIDSVRTSGEYDLVRRGTVFPTANELAAMNAIFDASELPGFSVLAGSVESESEKVTGSAQNRPESLQGDRPENDSNAIAGEVPRIVDDRLIITEADAMFEMFVIPLYFPTSYSLVKPYVQGFDVNVFDAVVLNDVSIDENWNFENLGLRR